MTTTINTHEGKIELLDDPIKIGDSFYNPHSGRLHIAGTHTDFKSIHNNGCKKVLE